MDEKQIAEFIKTIPIFHGFDQQNLESLSKICHFRTIAGGEYICKENATEDTLYIIVSGEVLVQKNLEGGEKIDLATLKSRNIIGEVSMLANIPRSADVLTKGNVELIELSASDFRSLIITDNWTAFRFVYELSRMLCWRLKKIDDKFTQHVTASSQCAGNNNKDLKNFIQFKEKLLKDWSF